VRSLCQKRPYIQGGQQSDIKKKLAYWTICVHSGQFSRSKRRKTEKFYENRLTRPLAVYLIHFQRRNVEKQ